VAKKQIFKKTRAVTAKWYQASLERLEGKDRHLEGRGMGSLLTKRKNDRMGSQGAGGGKRESWTE